MVIEAQAYRINQAMIGSRQRVLVQGLGKRDPGFLAARTMNNRVVNFAGDPRLINQMVDVTITEAFAHSLKGEMLVNA